jgi:hypothetical protein
MLGGKESESLVRLLRSVGMARLACSGQCFWQPEPVNSDVWRVHGNAWKGSRNGHAGLSQPGSLAPRRGPPKGPRGTLLAGKHEERAPTRCKRQAVGSRWHWHERARREGRVGSTTSRRRAGLPPPTLGNQAVQHAGRIPTIT